MRMPLEAIRKIKIYGYKKSFIYIFYEINRIVFCQLFLNSYSQKKEDIYIDSLLKNKPKGFYVDVGAHDPTRFSNTKRFYNKGWSGINIEPDVNRFKMFEDERYRDINLNIGIGKKKSIMHFYKFIPNTLSTFSETEAKSYIKQNYELEKTTDVPIETLEQILDKYCEGKTIDFMSIDTEGFDTEVLMSNNWKKYKPTVICIESVKHTMENTSKRISLDQEGFLVSKGYIKKYDNNLNSIYLYSKGNNGT